MRNSGPDTQGPGASLHLSHGLTCHDPLGLVGLHVASTLTLSRFAFEIVLGIKGIRVVISYGHLQEEDSAA